MGVGGDLEVDTTSIVSRRREKGPGASKGGSEAG